MMATARRLVPMRRVSSMVVMRSAYAGESDLHPAWPDYSILDVASDTSEDQLLDLWYVLQLGARAEEGGRGEVESEVGVKGEMDGGVVVHMPWGVRVSWCCKSGGRGEFESEGAREAFEGEAERDGQDGESWSREVDEEAGRYGERDVIGKVDVELDSLLER